MWYKGRVIDSLLGRTTRSTTLGVRESHLCIDGIFEGLTLFVCLSCLVILRLLLLDSSVGTGTGLRRAKTRHTTQGAVRTQAGAVSRPGRRAVTDVSRQ